MGNLQSLVAAVKALDDRELAINQEMSDRTAVRDKQRGKELKGLEDGHSKLAKEIASTESKLKNRQSDLEAQIESRKQSQTALGEIQKQVEVKEKAYQKEKTKFDAPNEQDEKVKKDKEKAQMTMQALTAGMSEQQAGAEGEGKSMRAELLDAQTKLSEMD